MCATATSDMKLFKPAKVRESIRLDLLPSCDVEVGRSERPKVTSIGLEAEEIEKATSP